MKSLSLASQRVCRVFLPCRMSGSERHALDFGGNVVGGNSAGGKRGHNVQEQSFGNGIHRRRQPVHGADIHRAIQVDLEKLLHYGHRARIGVIRLAPGAIALVHQEFVLIEGAYFAHAGTGGQLVSELMRHFAGRDVDRNDAEHFLGGSAFSGVLDERVLHDAYQRFAVRRDRQPFHAFVSGSASGVAADFVVTYRAQIGYIERRGQLEGFGRALRSGG